MSDYVSIVPGKIRTISLEIALGAYRSQIWQNGSLVLKTFSVDYHYNPHSARQAV